MGAIHRLVVVGLALAACSVPEAVPDAAVPPHDAAAARDAYRAPGEDAAATAPTPLMVEALGVQGFVLTYRGESVMTAPLFTRQSTIGVTLNLPLDADQPAIEMGLAGVDLALVRAVVSGHAHYDHLIDVPHVLSLVPTATLYANRSAGHILAALAPDRAASCTGPAASPGLDRSRVVALDDPANSHVDYTNCPDQQPPGAPLEGSWVSVPGSHIRLMPVCTTHPPQIGTIHFGEGSVDADLCTLPTPASGWLEGQTLSYVIDFLGDDGLPAFRIYYQDAPATRPIGEVTPAVLADHRVDLAILCVGSNGSVVNQPTDIIANLAPRFVFSGHWEDFFIPRDRPPQNILLLDVNGYVADAEAALAGAPADAPLLVDGAAIPGRHVLIQPGSHLVVPPAP